MINKCNNSVAYRKADFRQHMIVNFYLKCGLAPGWKYFVGTAAILFYFGSVKLSKINIYVNYTFIFFYEKVAAEKGLVDGLIS